MNFSAQKRPGLAWPFLFAQLRFICALSGRFAAAAFVTGWYHEGKAT
jgi:hypothetical protein